MSKKEKYLSEIEEYLNDYKFKQDVIAKYQSIIDEKLSSGFKINKILKELGTPEEISKIEISKRDINEKINKIFSNLKEKSKKTLSSVSEYFNNSFSKLKSIKLERKSKVKKLKKNIKKTKKNALKKVKEIIPIKKEKSKYRWLIFVVEVILFVILFYILTVFMASLVAILDGIKFYGLAMFLFALSIFLCLILSFLNKKRCCEKINSKLYFVSFIGVLLLLAIGVGYTVYNYFDIQYVNDINEKYSFITDTKDYNIPSSQEKFHIYFNSWYKNSYLIQIDNNLENKIKVEIKYYEAFYDLYSKRENGNLHISLAFDERDLISLYLNNLKENKIYNEKELSRYLVRIYVNEKNAERLIVHN